MPSDLLSSAKLSRRKTMSYRSSSSPRRRSTVRLAILAVLGAAVYWFLPVLNALPWFPSTGIDYTEQVEKIRQLQLDLSERWPRTGWAGHRDATLRALDRLAECMEKNTCGPKETTVLLLGSFHFGNSQTGHTSGEDIWAGSLVTILEPHNYTLLYAYETLEILSIYQALSEHIPLVFMESQTVTECIDLGTYTYQEALESAIAGVEYLSPDEPLGCAKRVGYENGIPMQKVRTFHFWDGQRHPLRGWTLSPYNYTGWPGDNGNYYLGYHLEHCRHVTPAAKHHKRAFILGKRPKYFTKEEFAWPQGVFEELTEEIGGGFEFVGGAGVKGVDEMPMKGITNLGNMRKEDWNKEVQESAVMLGIGNPPRSPSPYDALCLGVPFINPIVARNHAEPDNIWHWGFWTQHNALRELEPPYVYRVWKEDKEGLKKAIQAAIANPIEPFIPETFKRESVEARLLHLINTDWNEEAENVFTNIKNEGWANEATGENLENGLLL